MSSFLSAVAASTGATSTDTIVTSAFALSGSNRALAVMITTGASSTISMTPSRGSDTFTELAEELAGTSQRVFLYGSTNEPGTGSAALTVVRGSASQYWGFVVTAATDVDQTTRIDNITNNADVSTTGGLDTLSLPTGSGDLATDFFGTRGGYDGTAIVPSGSQTDRAGFHTGTASFDRSMRVSTQAGTGSNVNMSWSGFASGADVFHIGFTFKNGVTAPVANVTADDNPITYLDTATAVPSPPTVTAGTSSITSIVVSCDAGTVSFTASGSVTLSNNGTSSVTLQNGASETEYNTVLATMTHTRSTKGETTFTVAPSDGTLSDSKNFTRFVRPAGITFTGTQAQVRALIQSLGATLDEGETSGTFVLYVEDDTSPTPLTDSQTVTLMVSPPAGDGFLPLLVSTRTLTDVIL